MARVGNRGLWSGVLVIFSLGALLGTALADRTATAPPIVYSGQILMGSTPVADGSHMVGLSLFSTLSGASGGLCVMAPAGVTTTAGLFSLTLTSDCANSFETEEEVYVELSVDGTTLSRTRAGAVPFAVTAERVVSRSASGEGISDGIYRGPTATTFNGRVTVGGVTGYTAARAACAEAWGETAHVCTATELNRSAQLLAPGSIPAGRYATGVGGPVAGAGAQLSDCLGFTSDTGSYAAASWDATSDAPAYTLCDVTLAFLCCD